MAFTPESKKAAADVINNLARYGDHLSSADKMGLLVTSLAIEYGLTDAGLRACDDSEETFRNDLLSLLEGWWNEPKILESYFGGYIKQIHDAAEGDIKRLDQCVDWPDLHRSFRGAFSKLEDNGSGDAVPTSSSKIESLYSAIDGLFDAGQINDATYQFAADIIQLIDPDEQDYDVVGHAKELAESSIDELRDFQKERIEEWVEEDAEEAAERFQFGASQNYVDLQALLAATDFAYIKDVLLPLYLA